MVAIIIRCDDRSDGGTCDGDSMVGLVAETKDLVETQFAVRMIITYK